MDDALDYKESHLLQHSRPTCEGWGHSASTSRRVRRVVEVTVGTCDECGKEFDFDDEEIIEPPPVPPDDFMQQMENLLGE
jgi:transcription elongation factor Elf1